MKKLVGVAFVILLLAIGMACRDDVFVEPPPTLTGDYAGFISVKPDGQTATEQPITWRFSSNGFNMYWDEIRDLDSTRDFCDVSGTYELENGVTLSTTDSNLTSQTCNETQVPNGFFQLDQSTDTLKMTQYDDANKVTTSIRLKKEE